MHDSTVLYDPLKVDYSSCNHMLVYMFRSLNQEVWPNDKLEEIIVRLIVTIKSNN